MKSSSLPTMIRKLETEFTASKRSEDGCRANLRAAKADLATAKEVQAFLQDAAAQVQTKTHTAFNVVVSTCLRVIFGKKYSFEILFSKKRGKTEADLVFRVGKRIVNPVDEAGGGLVDIASFALRVAAICMIPTASRVLILDEPFKFLNPPEKYGPRIAEMLETLSNDLGFQFVLISHVKELQIGKVISLDSPQTTTTKRKQRASKTA